MNIPLRQSRALSGLALLAVGALVWMALPVGAGLFLGALVGFTLQPIHQRLRERGWHEGLAALTCTLVATLAATAALVVLAVLVVSRAIGLAGRLPEWVAPGGELEKAMDHGARVLAPLRVTPDQVTSAIRDEAMSLGRSAGGAAASIAGSTFGGALTLFFMALTSYSVLIYWTPLMRHLENLLPFERRHTHALLDQLRRVGRQVLRGSIVTGLIQGVAAGLVYWVTGAGDPAFWAALTAVASMVPAVGTLLIWVPMGLSLMLRGHLAAGLAELSLSVVFVGLIPDYVIRPVLVGTEKGIPSLITFVALFGGVEVFGLLGLVLGPVIAAMSVAVLKTYELATPSRRARARRAAAQRDQSEPAKSKIRRPPLDAV